MVSNPWDDISQTEKSGKIRLRRVDPEHPLDWFRAKDHEGNYLFVFQGRFVGREGVKLPELKNLEIRLEVQEEPGRCQLSVGLRDKTQLELFGVFCRDLMRATAQLQRGDDHAGVEVILARLHRWREMFKALREKRLTDAQVVGLFGEVLLLRDLFLEQLSPLEAVGAWRGPLGEEQDFLFGEWLVEVKTQLSSADSRIQVSSENQLDSESGRILICHQRLGIESAESETARCLNSLVEEVDDRLGRTDDGARDRFQMILVEYGYQNDRAYQKDFWVLNERSYFSVTDGFPCITSKGLPEGVETVQYRIRLASCEAFRLTEDDAVDRMFPSYD